MNVNKRRAKLTIGLLLAVSSLVSAQIAGLKPAPGSVAEGQLVVPAGSDGATEVLVTVVRGAKPGPTLAVIAGLSGADYGPIAAALGFLTAVKPAEVSGTIVVIHIANMPAFLDRSPVLNPIDHKDLARAFPGKADGTSSERIAYTITKEVLEKVDYVVSLQSGGANRIVQPYTDTPISGNAQLDAKVSAMALAFGINFIVADSNSKHPAPLFATAFNLGKPIIAVMSGSLGVADNRTVEGLGRGVLSLMNSLEITTGPILKARSPVYFEQTVVIDSPSAGMLTLYAQRGQSVHKGDPICGVQNYFGKNLQVLKSPAEGIVLSIVSTMPIAKGEPIVLIGIPR